MFCCRFHAESIVSGSCRSACHAPRMVQRDGCPTQVRTFRDCAARNARAAESTHAEQPPRHARGGPLRDISSRPACVARSDRSRRWHTCRLVRRGGRGMNSMRCRAGPNRWRARISRQLYVSWMQKLENADFWSSPAEQDEAASVPRLAFVGTRDRRCHVVARLIQRPKLSLLRPRKGARKN